MQCIGKKLRRERILETYIRWSERLNEKFSLAEFQDKPDFNAKFALLKEKWEKRCPRFYDWFLKNQKEKFENSDIASARDGSNVFGMFYQNNIESLLFI